MARAYVRGLQEKIAEYLKINQPAKTAAIAKAIESNAVKVSRTLQILAANKRVKMLQGKEWVLTGDDKRKPLLQDKVLGAIKNRRLTLKEISHALAIEDQQTRKALSRLKFAGLAAYEPATKNRKAL